MDVGAAKAHVACNQQIRRRWSGTLGLGGCWPLLDRVSSDGQAVRVSMVLVVEDEALVRLTICEGLASEGYEVLSAATADEAIEILESRNDISTVFTDVEMPGSMDGLKLAAAVRDRWPPINIVVTSGKSRPGNTQMPRNIQFIGKPYQTADVVRAFGAFI
jgi:two-component system, response regulator PdtaR